MQNTLDVVCVNYINKYIGFTDGNLMTNKLRKISGMRKDLTMGEKYVLF